MLALVNQVLVDLVGDGDRVVLDAELRDELELACEYTLPVGLLGVLMTIALVGWLKAAASSAASILKSGSCSVT